MCYIGIRGVYDELYFLHWQQIMYWWLLSVRLFPDVWVYGKCTLILFLSSLLELRPYFTAGSGKLILSCVSLHLVTPLKRLMSRTSSSVIEDLKNSHKARLALIVFFYFDFKDESKKNACGALSSLHQQDCHHYGFTRGTQ
jgi:hypothetical protein